MSIQWFPGHMHLTKKAITERMKDTDVVIEMLDARLPGSSANPMLAELTRGKPGLKVLNKQDLADSACTALWLDYYTASSDQKSPSGQAIPSMLAISLDASDGAPGARMVQACRALAPHRGTVVKPLRVLICGIPNVGKSTLINRLAGKRAAKTGDEAGVTKLEQRIALTADFYLYDTPGMLWPRIIVAKSGYNLAASGAVGRNAYDDEEVALELVSYLKGHYPGLIEARFKLSVQADMGDEELLDEIGRKRGALLSGGHVNVQKAAEIIIHEFRAATMGRITLETPAEYTQWLAAGQQADAERELKKKKPTRKEKIEAKRVAEALLAGAA
jgi:ribosome biogenesis GTPase A